MSLPQFISLEELTSGPPLGPFVYGTGVGNGGRLGVVLRGNWPVWVFDFPFPQVITSRITGRRDAWGVPLLTLFSSSSFYVSPFRFDSPLSRRHYSTSEIRFPWPFDVLSKFVPLWTLTKYNFLERPTTHLGLKSLRSSLQPSYKSSANVVNSFFTYDYTKSYYRLVFLFIYLNPRCNHTFNFFFIWVEDGNGTRFHFESTSGLPFTLVYTWHVRRLGPWRPVTVEYNENATFLVTLFK